MRPGQNGGKKRFKTANKSEFTAGHRASFVADSVLTVRGSPHFALVSYLLTDLFHNTQNLKFLLA